jgi:hypothetical protein
MTHRSAWGRAAYGKSIRAVRQSGPSERSLVRLNEFVLGHPWGTVALRRLGQPLNMNIPCSGRDQAYKATRAARSLHGTGDPERTLVGVHRPA